MNDKEKQLQFFNEKAEEWDNIRCPDFVKIEYLVNMIGFKKEERVLDIGCGTGVLLPHLYNAVGDSGLITALDFSENMVSKAVEKYTGLKGITFVVSDIMDYQDQNIFDKVLCFNFFPHVKDKIKFVMKMRHLLAEDGRLIIMHDISRDVVNGVHRGCESVKNDCLLEGSKVAEMLNANGYMVTNVIDNEQLYFIKAVKFKAT